MVSEDKAIGCMFLVWAAALVIGLGLIGVLVWAAIKLVLHATGG